MDILQDIVDWGRDNELEGSKVVATPIESGDTLQEVAPILPLEAGGMGAGIFHQHQGHRGGLVQWRTRTRARTTGSGTTRTRIAWSRIGVYKVKQEGGWGKEKRERRGKKGIERGGENTEIKGRVRGRGRVRGHSEVKEDDTGRVITGDKNGIKGRVRGGGSVQTSVRRRRVYEESIPVTKLPERRDLFWKEVYGESRKEKRRLCGEDYGKIGYVELEGVRKDRGASMDGRGAKGGILVGSTTWFGGEEVSKYDSRANGVCRQSMGRVEGSKSVREWYQSCLRIHANPGNLFFCPCLASLVKSVKSNKKATRSIVISL
jgi:hypothetical protein